MPPQSIYTKGCRPVSAGMDSPEPNSSSASTRPSVRTRRGRKIHGRVLRDPLSRRPLRRRRERALEHWGKADRDSDRCWDLLGPFGSSIGLGESRVSCQSPFSGGGPHVFWVACNDAHHPVKRRFGPLLIVGGRVGNIDGWRSGGFVVEDSIPLGRLKEGRRVCGARTLDARLARLVNVRTLVNESGKTSLTARFQFHFDALPR